MGEYQTDNATSSRMRSIKSSGTSLEGRLAALIHKSGFKYRSQPQLIGKPDFWIFGTNVVLFADSSFWHGRRKREISGKAFKRNRSLWVNKLRKNKSRATTVNRNLSKRGWLVLRLWDDDIIKKTDLIVLQIRNTIRNESRKRKSIYSN